jgi:DNA-binding IclR family transcriptional regulator
VPVLSHDILEPHKTVNLNPFAVTRQRGEIDSVVKSAVRALHTLELLATAQGPLRAIDIARALNLSPSSANQLLKTMVDFAYLIFDPISKSYYPSPRIINLGASLSYNYFGFDTLEHLTRTIYDATGHAHNVLLATSQGAFMQILDVHRGQDQPAKSRAGALDSGIGFRSPLFGSCIGAAWLSAQNEQKIRASIRLCRRELGREADNTAKIFERVRRVKEQGYAFGGLTEDDLVRTIAVPLPPCPNGIVLVVGIVGAASEFEIQRQDIVRLLKDTIRTHLKGASS